MYMKAPAKQLAKSSALASITTLGTLMPSSVMLDCTVSQSSLSVCCHSRSHYKHSSLLWEILASNRTVCSPATLNEPQFVVCVRVCTNELIRRPLLQDSTRLATAEFSMSHDVEKKMNYKWLIYLSQHYFSCRSVPVSLKVTFAITMHTVLCWL